MVSNLAFLGRAQSTFARGVADPMTHGGDIEQIRNKQLTMLDHHRESGAHLPPQARLPTIVPARNILEQGKKERNLGRSLVVFLCATVC